MTVASFDYDFWQGRVLAYNVVIHTPFQREWKWSSPIIARVGRVYVEFSLVAWALHVFTLLSLEQAPIDIYTVEVADVQVFVERQEQVFNFHLLDSSIILPDPKTIVTQDENELGMEDTTTTTTDNDTITTSSQQPQEEEEAHQLVDQMLTTVHQLVSRNGNWKGALDQQRHTLTSKLRELQSTPNKVSAVQQGVRVMRQMGHAVAKKTQDLPAAAVPLRRQEDVPPPPMVRVGRIVVSDLRIFTRDNLSTTAEEDSNDDILLHQWNKPIRIQNVTVRASELCPPMSSVDDNDLPAIYQPIDKVIEVVWKRLLAESAKSQGGRLLNAAIGQVLGIMKVSSRQVK